MQSPLTKATFKSLEFYSRDKTKEFKMQKSDIIKLKSQLRTLAFAVMKLVKKGINEKTLIPTEDTYFRWVLDEFEYSDKGITKSKAHGEHFTKKSWGMAVINLLKPIETMTEHKTLLKSLKPFKSDASKHCLFRFTGKVINCYLDNKKIDEKQIDTFISVFLKELGGKPVKYGAAIELQGIVLRSNLIKITHDITLRKVKKKDLEKGFLALYPMGNHQRFVSNHTAILNIEFLGTNANEIQQRMNKAIAILRLFKPGSIRYVSCRRYSDSIIDVMASGKSINANENSSLNKYLVIRKEEEKLIKFWKLLDKHLPESFFLSRNQSTDNKTISYKRYSDALFRNGIIERRIANVIMGLEALFLKNEPELSYKLSFRISKLLGLFDHEPLVVRKTIKDAYSIRSTFVHGDQIKGKEKKKLDDKYGNLNKLLLKVLGYLRVSIIITILCEKEKEELIRLIDDSLISKKRALELVAVMSMRKLEGIV